MAKAKSTSSDKTPGKAKAAAKAPAKGNAKPHVAASGPSVDPTVVSAAASLVAHKFAPAAPVAFGGAKTESTSFKNLKESLNKPHSQIMGGLLDKISMPGQKKSALPFGGGKQVGHNQIIGSDASRKNVPRRTGG